MRGVKLIFNNSEEKKREKCKDSSKIKCNLRTVIECCDDGCELTCKLNSKDHGKSKLMACCKPGCSKIKPCLSCTRGGVIPMKLASINKPKFVSKCCPIEPIVNCEEPPADICGGDPCILSETLICNDSCNAPIIVAKPKLCRSLKSCPCDHCKNVRFKDKCEIIPPCSNTNYVSAECKPNQPFCKPNNKCLPTRLCGQSTCKKSNCKPKCTHSNPCGLSDCRKCAVQCKPMKPSCHKPLCVPQCTSEDSSQLTDCRNKSCRPKCLPSRPCCHQSCTKSYCKPKCCPSSPCCQPECVQSYCTLKCTPSKPCMKTNCKKSYCGVEELEVNVEPEQQQFTPSITRTNTTTIPEYWQNKVQCKGCESAKCSKSLIKYKQSNPPPCPPKQTRKNINHPEYY